MKSGYPKARRLAKLDAAQFQRDLEALCHARPDRNKTERRIEVERVAAGPARAVPSRFSFSGLPPA